MKTVDKNAMTNETTQSTVENMMSIQQNVIWFQVKWNEMHLVS